MTENRRDRKYTARKVKQVKEKKVKVNHDEVGINGITRYTTKTIYQVIIFLWTTLRHFTQYFAIQARKLGQSTETIRLKMRKTRNSEKGKITKKGRTSPRKQGKGIATSLPRENKHSAGENSPRTNRERWKPSSRVLWNSLRRNTVSLRGKRRSPPKNQHSPQENNRRITGEQPENWHRTAKNRPRTNHVARNTSTYIPHDSLLENTQRINRETIWNNYRTKGEQSRNNQRTQRTERTCGTHSLGGPDRERKFTSFSHNSNPWTVAKATQGQHTIVKLTVLIVNK